MTIYKLRIPIDLFISRVKIVIAPHPQRASLTIKGDFAARTLAVALICINTVHADALSFSQCVDIALKQNPDLMGSHERINQAQAGLTEAQGNRVPKVTASFNAIGTNDALNAFGMKLSQRQATFNDFGAGQFNPGALNVAPNSLNYPGFVHNFNTRVQVDVPIYSGGMISGGIKQAQAFIAAAQSGDQAARQQVIYQVLQAYEGVYAARAYLSVTQRAEIAARSQVKMMQSMAKGGTIVKSDLLLEQVHLQDVLVQRDQAENAVDSAIDQLHMLLGMQLDQPLDVGEPITVKPLGESLTVLSHTAEDNNPGIQALRHQVDADGANIDIANAASKPQIGLMLRQDWNDAQLGFAANSWTVGGSLSWTAFDGGITHAKIDHAHATKNETLSRLQQAVARVDFQVADARRKALESEKRLAQRQLALSQVEEAVQLVNKRYSSGVATITEQLDAQAELVKARADVVSAEYDLAVQRASLKLAIGQLDPNSI